MNTRQFWIQSLQRVASPVLNHLSEGTLHQRMPVESHGGIDREKFTHLEALGRSLAGIAPWLETREPESRELSSVSLRAIANAVNPKSPDCCNFTEGSQPVVDAAFLAQALLRAPSVLLQNLPPECRSNLIRAFLQTRRIVPHPCNWLLFSATIEAALLRLGADGDAMRIAYALRQHEQWYKGDGHYGDGPSFHTDYYNSFVIQPMMVDIIAAVKDQMPEAQAMEEKILLRSARYAAVLERMISPEGTFPPIGRSLAYRFGAMQSLAQMALLKRLPDGLSPAQVREALGAVLRRFMSTPAIFDESGWLCIGLGGHQPELGEPYISTGSLYLFTLGFLPLGLPASDPFWADPEQPWTSVKAWGGTTTPIDHAIHS